ncbi:MAG: AAA family ATPase [Promethearchaeota archaeon]
MIKKEYKFNINFTNFGPIKNGDIFLRPLTIFVGPNNSGKSYSAKLIYSILKSFSALPEITEYSSSFFPLFLNIETFSSDFKKLENKLIRLQEGSELILPETFYSFITKKIYEDIYTLAFKQECSRIFSADTKDLIKFDEKSIKINVKINETKVSLEIKKDSIKILDFTPINANIKFRMTSDGYLGKDYINKNDLLLLINVEYLNVKKEREKLFRELRVLILNHIRSILLNNIKINHYYLPAGRSGILQTQKQLFTILLGENKKTSIPGLIADFFSTLISSSKERGPFFDLAEEFEQEILNGKILFEQIFGKNIPEIYYKFQKKNIDIKRTSSTISELAVFVLFLKYTIKPGDILIFEEPEVHLHPGNQRILAKYLIRLVRKGVKIILTTHSEYLLDQISNFILLSKIGEKKRKEKFSYTTSDFLNIQEINTYLFAKNKNTEDYTTTPVNISEDDGISDREFMKVIDALYDETVRIHRDLNSED